MKKGFTLIELLAVIVVLAIIALIATPLVLNTIEESRKGAAKESVTIYMSQLEIEMLAKLINGETIDFTPMYKVSDVEVDVKGTKPTEGNICIGNDGLVTKYSVKIDNYIIDYNGFTQTVTKEGEVKTLTCINDKFMGEWNDTTDYNTGDIVLYNGEYYEYLSDVKASEGDRTIPVDTYPFHELTYTRLLPDYKISYTEIDPKFKGSRRSVAAMQCAYNSDKKNSIFIMDDGTYKTCINAGSGSFGNSPIVENYNPYDSTTWY